MKSISDFKKGQHVSTYDEDEKKIVYGEVITVNKEQETVIIKWEDLSDWVLHNASEFENIFSA